MRLQFSVSTQSIATSHTRYHGSLYPLCLAAELAGGNWIIGSQALFVPLTIALADQPIDASCVSAVSTSFPARTAGFARWQSTIVQPLHVGTSSRDSALALVLAPACAGLVVVGAASAIVVIVRYRSQSLNGNRSRSRSSNWSQSLNGNGSRSRIGHWSQSWISYRVINGAQSRIGINYLVYSRRPSASGVVESHPEEGSSVTRIRV